MLEINNNKKQAYSVDRVESRRQRRRNIATTENLLSVSRISNKKSQRSRSEGRSLKSVAHNNRQQKQVSMFLLKNNSKNDYIEYKTKGLKKSECSLLHMKSASMKSTQNEISNFQDSKL